MANSRQLFCLCLTLSFLTVTPVAMGQPTPIRDEAIELTSRNERMLDSIAGSSLAQPVRPSVDRDLVLIISGGGGLCSVMTLAKPSKEANALATDLAKAFVGTQIEDIDLKFNSLDDYAIVKGELKFGYFGKHYGKLELPIGTIAARLSSSRWKPTIFLRTYKAAKVTSIGMKVSQSARINTYGASLPDKSVRATVEVETSALTTFAFWFFLLGPWVLTILGLGTAFIVAKNGRIPVDRRRMLYPKIATWPTFGSIAVHVPFAIWFIIGRGYQPFVDLWFSSSSASTIIPFIMLPMAAILLLFPVVQKTEQRLFGPDDKAPVMPQPPAEVRHHDKKIRNLGLVIAACGLLLLIARLAFSNNNPVSGILTFAGLGLIVFSSTIAGKLLEKSKPTMLPVEVPAEAESQLKNLAADMGISHEVKLKIDDSPIGRVNPHASVDLSGRVTMTARMLELLSSDERKAILAHELAHIKLGHIKSMRRLAGTLFILLAIQPMLLMFGVASTAALLQIAPYLMGLPLVAFPLILIFLPRLKRAREYACDRIMIETTRDPDSAISAFQKMTVASAMPHIHEVETASTHPAISKRIASIRKFADELGIHGDFRTEAV